MSMFVYNKFGSFLAGAFSWASGGVLRALLERSTSTYAPNRDHDFLDDFTGGGGVEITVASYARQTLGGRATTDDLAADRTELDINDIAFGNLESGQTVKALILYNQTGGSDATPADDELILYYDGKIDVTLAANAAGAATTIYVDPLLAPLANGTALDFGGGGTCTLTEAGDIGERELTCSALGAARVAGDISLNVSILNNILPFALGGGAFNIVIDAEGLIQLKAR